MNKRPLTGWAAAQAPTSWPPGRKFQWIPSSRVGGKATPLLCDGAALVHTKSSPAPSAPPKGGTTVLKIRNAAPEGGPAAPKDGPAAAAPEDPAAPKDEPAVPEDPAAQKGGPAAPKVYPAAPRSPDILQAHKGRDYAYHRVHELQLPAPPKALARDPRQVDPSHVAAQLAAQLAQRPTSARVAIECFGRILEISSDGSAQSAANCKAFAESGSTRLWHAQTLGSALFTTRALTCHPLR